MTNPIQSSKAKRGRKAIDFVCPWDGKTINGLYRKGEKVWRVRSTGQEFTEADPRRAVDRFLAITAAQPRTVPLIIDPATEAVVGDIRNLRGNILPPEVIANAPAAKLTATQISIGEDGQLIFARDIDESAFFRTMTHLLLHRREYCAQKTGIEQLAWLTDLKRPEKGAALKDIGEVYFQHAKLSPNELSRSKTFWDEFVRAAKAMGIATIDNVTHELVAKYEKTIEGRKLAPKSILHRYRKIRGILHFAIRRGQSIEHCRAALDTLAMLQVKQAHPLDPTPISPKDFWAIHAEAVKAEDHTFAALMLMALNAALYGGEVASVQWEEIDAKTGGYVSRRSKTGVSRIAMLWPATIKAIAKLPHDRAEVFLTKVRSYTVFSVGDKFEKYRDAAKVSKDVTFSWIRDAAYSIAMEATSFEQAELLAGHRLPGTADAYLRRNPQLVADACKAIWTKFAPKT